MKNTALTLCLLLATGTAFATDMPKEGSMMHQQDGMMQKQDGMMQKQNGMKKPAMKRMKHKGSHMKMHKTRVKHASDSMMK